MAVLETPWFMKTKTSDLGRVNKVFDERFQANISLLQIKRRKALMKLDDEMKTIKSEFKHIRSEVDFSKDLDEHGKPIDEMTYKAKAAGQEHRLSGKHLSHDGSHGIPPELELEHKRYLKIRQRDNRRELTMLELRDMCHRCLNDETGDTASKYIQNARLVLFPKQKRLKPIVKTDNEEDTPRFSKYGLDAFSQDIEQHRPLQLPPIDIAPGKDTPENVPIASDRVTIRPSSATSIASGIKPALPRYKSMDIVGSSDVPSSLGLMTSVSV